MLLIGRGSFDAMQAMGGGAGMWEGMQTVVVSTAMRPVDYPSLAIVAEAKVFVAEQRRKCGKDIWLFGGGRLFQSLLDVGLVDDACARLVRTASRSSMLKCRG
jgi:dihydrofolate reductase